MSTLLPFTGARVLLVPDLDGTVLPAFRDAADWTDHRGELRRMVRRIAALPGVALAVVTGRRARNARALLDAPVWVTGSHGAETLAPYAEHALAYPVPPAEATRMRRFGRSLMEEGLCPPEMHVENKEVILAVHHPGTATRLARTRLAPAATVARAHGLRVVDGRGWTEFRVPSCPDKGTAVRALVRRWRPRLLVVAGDDLGDVAMFEAADRLRRHGHVERCVRLAVRGPGALAAREHGCDLVLDGPAACRAWLLRQALSAVCGPARR